MAAKKTNWGAILLVLGLVIAAWYLLTRRRAAAGSSGGAVGPGGGGPLALPQRQTPGGGSGLSGGGGFPGGGGGGGGNPLASILRNFLGQQNAYNQQVAMFLQPQNPDLSGVTIPSIPFDWGGFSPNDFLVTQDIPGYNSDVALAPDYIDSGAIPYQPFDYGTFSPNDFLVTQDVPADTSSYDTSIQVQDTSQFLPDTIDANGNDYYSTGFDYGASTSGGGGGIDTAY